MLSSYIHRRSRPRDRRRKGHGRAQLGIQTVSAEVLSGRKADKVQELQQQGTLVAMVGNGVKDAPALAQADIGIAIGTGDVAMGTADVVMKSDPFDVIGAIALSRVTARKMKQNLFWAVSYKYKTIAFPIAAGAFYPVIGLLLRPEIAAISLAGSSLLVALNALLLKRTRLPGIRRVVAEPVAGTVLLPAATAAHAGHH